MGEISFANKSLSLVEIVCYAKKGQYASVEERKSELYCGRSIKLGKNRKAKVIHKNILAVLLTVALFSEPFFDMPAVYAEEIQEQYGEDETDSVSGDDIGEDDNTVGGDNVAEEDGKPIEDVADTEESGSEENGGTDEETGDTISGNEMDEGLSEGVEELSGKEKSEDNMSGFADMPSDYRLTSFQQELKAGMSDTLRQFKENEEGETFAEDQVITFAESEEEAELIADAYCAEIVNFDMGVLTLNLHKENTVKAALLAAADMDNKLPPVWPNYVRELYGEVLPETENVPEIGFDDPYLQTTSSRYQWFHTTIGSAYAWDAGYTGDGVKVGVIDSGVDANTDLDGNIFGKRDFCDGTEEVGDYVGHGTHVAGIIAAEADNATGGAGVAPQAKVFNARVFGKTASKSGYDATIIGAINYLIGEENNATGEEVSSEPAKVDIINMSLGGPGMSGAFQAVLDKAYQKGVVVFAATGNDGGSLMMYPASYNHVIGVSATDNNNERAYFSNYGSSTDLAAPGVNIWATYRSAYSSLQGTSMACPVTAGEAAVILSGSDDLPLMKDAQGNDKTGKARVDAVESVMKGNTVSAGSGMGKGITSLTKVFKLSAAAAKPNAPVIDVRPDETKQSVTVTIQVQDGMTLCYTTNGRNPIWKNGDAGADTILVSGNRTTSFTLDCSKSAKGTVKAIAVNASGVVSPVKSVNYILHPYVSTITVSGPRKMEQGKSIQLTAAVAPAYAANKNVTWELQTAQGTAVDTARIKIDQRGKITTAKNADTGDYTVTVRAKDEGGSFAQYAVQVVAAGSAIQSLAFEKNGTRELWLTKTDSAPTFSLSARLIAREKNAQGVLTEIDNSILGDRVTWTSSKPAVAEVDDNGVVTARAPGTTAVTAKANDNNGKKATISITVKQAVTDIAVTSDKGKTSAGEYTVAAGKSMILKAVVGPAKPANKRVNWSIRRDPADTAVSSVDMKNITIHQTSGKITVKGAAVPGNYIVTATAADGKGAAAEQKVKVCGSPIGEISLDTKKTTLYTRKIDEQKTNTRTITAVIKGAKGAIDFDPGAYTVTSSNTSVATAAVPSEAMAVVKEDGTASISITVTTTGDRYGTTNVTIASTDGSNKRATCVVTVSGGIKKVQLKNGSGSSADKVSKVTLFRNGTDTKSPKTTSIYAVIDSSEGANSQAYEVTSSNPSLIQVTVNKTTGQITLTAGGNITGRATVTLATTDGSRKKAACTVTVNNPPSRINIAPKAGTTKYVVAGKSVQLKATLETEYGTVAGKGVTWSIPDTYKGKGITVSSAGKVSVPRSYTETSSFPVTATAKDGSGVSASYYVYVVKATTYINAGEPTGKSVITITFSSDCSTPMSCTSSAPGVASPQMSYSTSSKTGTIRFVPMKKGTATITLKALDSSGKTCRIVYRVR